MATPAFAPDPARPGYLYQKFADYLASLVDAGVLRPGARLPGERDLALEHGVSVGTVRRATAVLRERGTVVTLPAKGTFVALASANKPIGESRPCTDKNAHRGAKE